MKNDFLIAETACSHNGNIKELRRLIKRVSKTKVNIIKFQIFYPEERTFKGDDEYDLFHRLLLNQTEWSSAVRLARSYKLKIFADIFGYKSFNLAKKLKVDGYKIHSEDSSNYNFVKKILVEEKPTFVSISGLESNELEDLIKKFKNYNNFIPTIGFQNFPTTVKDHNLKEIQKLKNNFSNLNICYTDHISCKKLNLSKKFPSYAFLSGADFCEKHVAPELNKKYEDYESAILPEHLNEVLDDLNKLQTFSNFNVEKFQSALDYRRKFKKFYFYKKNFKKGQKIKVNDLCLKKFKLFDLPSNVNLSLGKLIKDVNKNDYVSNNHFKRKKIGIVILSRSASIRFPSKYKKKLGNISLLEFVIKRSLLSKFSKNLVIATGNLEKKKFFYKNLIKKYSLKSYFGNDDDPSLRILNAAKKYGFTDVIRVTSDDPFRCIESMDKLCEEHIKYGFNASKTINLPYGTHTEIINTNFLKNLLKRIKNIHHREYLEEYLMFPNTIVNQMRVNNGINFDQKYRLTIDYKEDYKFINKLLEKNIKFDSKIKKIVNEINKSNSLKSMTKKLQQISKSHFERRKNINTLIL